MDLKKIYRNYTYDPALPSVLKRYENTFKQINQSNIETLLDSGCGEGTALNYIDNPDIKLKVAFDISESLIKLCKEKADSKTRLVSGDIRNLPFSDKSFSTVICFEVLEHVPDWKKALNELLRVSKNELYVTTPYKEKVVKMKCPSCKESTYFNGHINEFNEKSFDKWNKDHSIEISYVSANVNLSYYVRRFFKTIPNYFQKKSIAKKTDRLQEKDDAVCMNCNQSFPHTLLYTRTKRRIQRLVFKKPDNIMVKFTHQTNLS